MDLYLCLPRFLDFWKKKYIGLYKHVTESNLSIEQFGFKENSSMEKATYKLIKEILDSLNKKNYR
jgi:hypothetical protein